MKIVFDHTAFVVRFGGVSRYLCELAAHLNSIEETEVKVIAPFFPNEYLKTLDRSIFKGPHWIGSFKGGHRLAQVGRALKKPFHYWMESDADILHETYYSLNRHGKARRRVVTVHDMNHERFPGLLDDDIGSTKEKRAAVDRADHIICVSESTRRDLIEHFGVEPDRISVTYLASSFENLNFESRREPGHLQSDKPFILFVGGRHSYKNFSNLCKAYASSWRLRKEFDLALFGGGPFSEKEKDEIERLGIGNSIIHLSGGDSELVAAYRTARLLVYPSLYEGFGIPLLEAMTLGCPVACSDTSSLPEVAGEAAEYFNPTGFEEIAMSIEKVAFDDSYRSELISKGTKRASLFSWRKCAEETRRVYADLL